MDYCIKNWTKKYYQAILKHVWLRTEWLKIFNDTLLHTCSMNWDVFITLMCTPKELEQMSINLSVSVARGSKAIGWSPCLCVALHAAIVDMHCGHMYTCPQYMTNWPQKETPYPDQLFSTVASLNHKRVSTINVCTMHHETWATNLIWCGFIFSVLTDPSMSLRPYSMSVSSPALKTIHTWRNQRQHYTSCKPCHII